MTLAIGPFLVVAFWPRPPLVLGVIAGLVGFGVLIFTLVQGSIARVTATMSAASGDELQTYSIAAVLGAILAIGWLVLVTGIWSAALENSQSPHAGVTSDYALLALWHVANAIPFLDVPRTLGFPDPPVEAWGLGTGIALLLLGFAVVFSIVMVVSELLVRRNRN
ncbi:MAG TPA: hypothetical protein VJA46_05780 [Acidimicrobiia bacterium]|nr:hypothetical protein [Acidimicrobiia bacterium]